MAETTSTPELRINGSNTLYKDYGLRMGEGFIDALTEPLSLKDNVENESRLEHGKRVIVESSPKFQSREVTLDFTLAGSSASDLLAKKNAFLALVYKGAITVEIPKVSSEVYHLIYKGKGSEYAMSTDRRFCHMMLKFEEPDPSRRTLA